MVTEKAVIDSINESLHRDYRVLDGRPIYRIVWSDDQYEVRKGMFTDWYGAILIRQEYSAVRTIKKYWYFTEPCWVLEKLVFIQDNQALKEIQEELVNCRNGSYETIYPFRDKDNKPLPVAHRVVDFIIFKLHNPTKVDNKLAEQIEEKEEVDYFYNEISEGERSPLFVWENSAFVSTNQLKYKQEYIEKDTPITSGVD